MNLVGTALIDALVGLEDEENNINAKAGDDGVSGGKLNDDLRGGRGDDVIWGDRGDDVIRGDSGDDRAYGSVGNDDVRGGTDNDWISGGKDNDLVFGGRGNDAVHGNTGDDRVAGGSGDDLLMGEAGNDVMFGGRGNDAVYGGSGNDYVLASSGNDVLSGGSGDDTLDFSRMAGALTIDLGKHTSSVGSGNAFHTGTVSGFETVIGTNGNDSFTGDRNGQTLVGGAGDDMFRGKLGADVLTGGEGSDTFVELKKDTADGSVDLITDFELGVDRLDMSDFLKGHNSYDQVLRFAEGSAAGGVATTVQGLVHGMWTDVVTLAGVDHSQVSFADLGLLAA